MTLHEVAFASGNKISAAYIGQIERGVHIKPSTYTLYALANALHLTAEQLMARALDKKKVRSSTDTVVPIEHHTFSIHELSYDEKTELLEHLHHIRAMRKW